MPNRNDNGTLNPGVTGRLVTGPAGHRHAGNPQIYVVSSDPRIGAGTSGADLDLDTNSGILSPPHDGGRVDQGRPRARPARGPRRTTRATAWRSTRRPAGC